MLLLLVSNPLKADDIQEEDTLAKVYIHASSLSSDFSDGTIRVGNDGEPIACDIKYRGASSQHYDKKSFAVKLKDAGGNKLDMQMFGMRSDNYWILDAMAIDVARMRNRVSMDLWNDFSHRSYIHELEPGMLNGTRGRFVEVYLNAQYWGIYCLSERLDRKQLKLKKFNDTGVRGILYKSFRWSPLYADDSAYYVFDNSQPTWNGWELSYPDVADGEPIDWLPLSDIIHWLSYSGKDAIRNQLAGRIDLPVWKDYFLLMGFICAEDNIAKNQYVYYYNASKADRILGIAPWDMDHSWGRDYKGEITDRTDARFNVGIINNRIANILVSNDGAFGQSLKERYAELRPNEFSADALKQRFAAYFNLFTSSGAAERETLRWNGANNIYLDFAAEEDYISTWIDARLAYTDSIYDYTPSGIHTIQHTTPQPDKVFNLQGQCLGRSEIFKTLPHGIYIINGRKVIK